MLGRGAALTQLEAVLDAARGGRALVAVYGEPGHGKSRLLEALVSQRPDAHVVTMQGHALDTGIGYAALHALLLDHSHLLERAGDPSAGLLRAVLTGYRPPESALAMGAALSSWLDYLVPEGQLLVLVDDADLVDEDSLRILTYAASKGRRGRTCVVLAASRPVPLLARVGAHVVRLDDLGPGDVRTLLTSLRAPAASHRALAHRLGGNPLALGHAARALRASPWTSEADVPLAPRLREHVRESVSALPGPVRHLLETAAVTGQTRLAVLDRWCGTGRPGEVGQLVRQAEEADLLDADSAALAWRRPWVAESVRQLCPPGRRARLAAGALPSPRARPSTGSARADPLPPTDRLTPAELRVTDHLLTGLTLRQAARKLVLSEKTVDAQVQSIYRKLGVHSRSQLLVALLQRQD